MKNSSTVLLKNYRATPTIRAYIRCAYVHEGLGDASSVANRNNDVQLIMRSRVLDLINPTGFTWGLDT